MTQPTPITKFRDADRAVWRAYTEADDDRIIELRYRQHLSVAKIGKQLGRRHASINTRLHHPALLARIPEDLRLEVKAAIGQAPLDASKTKSLTPTAPKVEDRPDVVVHKHNETTFWRTREISVSLPRLRCLEKPIEA